MTTKKIVILGTGGTIAGLAGNIPGNTAYTAAQLGVNQLVNEIPGLADGGAIAVEQVAQIDSKDMSFSVWVDLANRVHHHLMQDDVSGVVVTHGTDTLEETAYFLQAVLNPTKPVVLTCAMRPADALKPDGPQNMRDAVLVARCSGARGVLVVCAGNVHGAADVQKVHTSRLNAFDSGDAGLIGVIEKNAFKQVKNWPFNQQIHAQEAIENIAILNQISSWPTVEIVMSYAGAGGELVDMLVAKGVQGLVVAGTGNGTVHRALESALLAARVAGVLVVRATRCAQGSVTSQADDPLSPSNGLSPVKARIRLMLQLMRIQAPS